MRKLLAVLVLALLPSFAAAQIPPGPFGANLGNMGPICPGPGALCRPLPSYTGPGDLVAGWLFWGGLRAFSVATAGTKAANICNSGDANCADVNTLSNGAFDVTTARGAPLNCGGTGGTCTVKTLYDKSGNGNDLTQATAANRPTLTLNCLGSLPCMSYAVNGVLINAGAFTQAQPMTLIAVENQTSNNGGHTEEIGDGGAVDYIGFAAVANSIECVAGGTTEDLSLTDGNWAAGQCLANGTSSSFTVNGTTTTFSGGAGGISGQPLRSGNLTGSASGFFTGKIAEIGISTTGFTTGNLSAMNGNIRNYWGF